MEENQIIVDVGLDAFIASLRHLQKQYELNTAALKAMQKAGEEQSDAYITLTQEQKVLRQQMASTEKAMQNEIKMQQAQEGSLVQLRAQLANLNKQYDSMSGMERMGKSGEELQGRIKALHDQILGLEGDTGRMQRNVGNYPDAMKPVTAQLREMTQQLVQLRMEGKANTEEYQQLLQKTGQMKDAMMDAQNEVKQMASDTSTLNSVLAGAQAAAGGFSVALGIMNLVGDKDSETAKELAEAQRKLQSAIAITTGLQALQNALQKESALMMGVNKLRMLAAAAAQRAYAAATRDAEAAQVVFNKVAKSNIYVWLASVILTVVGAIAAFTRGSKDQRDEVEKVNFELKRQLDYLKELTEAYRGLATVAETEAQNALDLAKARGASLDEIREKEDALLKAKRDAIEADKERLKYTEQEYNLLVGQYSVALDEYRKKVENTKQITNAAVLAMAQQELEADKGVLDSMKERLDLFNDLRSRMQEYRLQYTTTQKTRREEDARTTETISKNITHLKREAQELVEILTSEDIYNRIEQRNAHLAESFQKVADRVGLLKEEFEQLDPNKFGSSFVSDEGLQDNTTKMELWAEAWKNNASEIQETTTALESSFGSLSSMYQQMAKDESKTEEEREKAAKKAKAWAGIQIGANAGAAIAKGVASAVDVGFPAAIPAMATMMAAILAAIAQAKALVAEAHEHGGVIGGKFTGATRGSDNVLMTGRRGELVLDADQQKRLYDIANGGASTNLTAELAEVLQSMPAPVLVYSEFQKFSNRVVTLDDASKLQ
jgi:chromosome segregation ATPase